MLARMKGDQYDLVVFDTSPRADRDLVVIAGLSDLIILPVRPSILDIPALEDTVKLIKAAGRGDRAVLVLNAVATRTDEGDDASDLLRGMGRLLPQRLGDRVDLRRALTGGRGVTEFLPRSKAAEEVRALYAAIGGTRHRKSDCSYRGVRNMASKPKMSTVLGESEPEAKPRREKIYNAKSTPGRQGRRGLTYYVFPATLEELKAIAEQRSIDEDVDILLKDVVQEALNLVLVKYGRKPTA